MPLVLLVVLMAAVVAVSTGSLRLLQPALDLGFNGSWLLRAAGATVAALGVAWLLFERRRIGVRGLVGTDPTFVGLRTAATIMAAIALLALVNPPQAAPTAEDDGGGFGAPESAPMGSEGFVAGDPDLPPTTGGEPAMTADPAEIPREQLPIRFVEEPEPSLLQRLMGLMPEILATLLVVVGLWVLSRQVRHDSEYAEDPPLDLADAEAGLEASLAEAVRFGSDPRGRITEAYHQLMSALAEAGAERRPEEAPHEHLYRTLGPLGVRPEPLHDLAELYVLAQFGGRPVTERHQGAAVEALELSLADLRIGDASLAEAAAATDRSRS